MTDPEILLILAKRCEAATGPDHVLDSDIADAIGKPQPSGFQMQYEGDRRRPYTASNDDAIRLIPPNFWWYAGDNFDGAFCTLDPFKDGKKCGDWVRSFSQTVPLSICAAALKALAQEAPSEAS